MNYNIETKCIHGDNETNKDWEPSIASVQTEIWWKDQVACAQKHGEQREPDDDQVFDSSIHLQ